MAKRRVFAYIASKLLLTIPMLLILLAFVFVLIRVLPGDPARLIMGEVATEEEVAALRHQLGLDRPIHLQFLSYLWDLLRGNLGYSLRTTLPVSYMIGHSFMATLELALVSLIMGVAFGLVSGYVSFWKRNTILDYLSRIVSFGAFSMPIFWFGMMTQLLFAAYLDILPIAGRISIATDLTRITGILVLDSILTFNFTALVNVLWHLILPGFCLAFIWLAPQISRISAESMNETSAQDFVTTARAKGLRERDVIYRHILRNALIPIVTVISLNFAGLLGGSILTENVFSWPGLGSLLVTALYNRDLPVVQGIVVVYALMIVATNTIVDILYVAIDPRITH